ncbi:hypothetical protein C4556_02870 [Candidatus Parcubacteria bacterium]|nr:MAG: hypothetical protein C4556_02870 [Candidatus Parcubacteria bacterium]
MKQFLTAVIIVAIAGGAYWWWQNQNTATNGEMMDSGSETTGNDSMQDAIEGGAMMEDGVMGDGFSAPMTATITYNGTSFSPGEVTIKKGGTVTWNGTGNMWVASAQHPTHTVYAGTSLQEHCPSGSAEAFDQCATGNSYSFTFDKVGTWFYHDHINASAFGSVVVVE